MSKYIEEGKKAFKNDKQKYSNPYKPGTQPYNDYERGWTQALKREPDYPSEKY